MSSLSTGQREGLPERTSENFFRWRREGPSSLTGEAETPKSKNCSGMFRRWDEAGAPGVAVWGTVRGDPPGRGLSPGLWSGRADAARCGWSPRGRQAQGVRVEVWRRSRSKGEHGIGCQLTISDWLVAGCGVVSVVGWERSTRSAGPPRGGVPAGGRPRLIGAGRPWWRVGVGAGVRDGGAVDLLFEGTAHRPVLYQGTYPGLRLQIGRCLCVLISRT